MKVYVDFNLEEQKTEERVNQLLSCSCVRVDEYDLYFSYTIEPNTLEEFDAMLVEIEKLFNLEVDFILSPNRLTVFLEFS